MPKMWRKRKIMTTVKVTPYVTYLLPASFFSAEKVEAIPERNPQQQAVDAPKEAFAFYYYDIVTVVVEHKNEEVCLESEHLDMSGTHYIGGKVYALDDLENQPDRTILAANLRSFNAKAAILTRVGNFQPFFEGDEVIEI